MNRVLSFLILLSVCGLALHAQVVTPEAARQRAATFLNERKSDGPYKVRQRVDAGSLTVTDASASIYAVNASDEAFVLVAKTDVVDGVLGYCDNGSFDSANQPENFRAMLYDMDKEVTILSSLENPEQAKAMSKVTRKAIAPMLKSQWNQGEASVAGNVYNCQCPKYTYSNGTSYYCYTGCVATAMAQLMYFYKYPTTTKKTIPGFTSNTSIGYLSSLEVTSFDWGNMQDEYLGTELTDVTSYRSKPISKLMKYCGYAVKMNYGTGSSLSSSYNLLSGLVEYFGYNANAYIADRMNYSVEEWNNLIYNELSAGRPVLYSGSSTSSGHQFLIDGIDSSGKYHVNWGWGGRFNGYYLINVLNPHTTTSAGSSKTPDGYSIDQDAIIGMQPSKTGVLGGLTVVYSECASSELSFNFFNRTNQTSNFYYGFGAIASNGSVQKVLTSTTVATSIDPNSGYQYDINFSMLSAYLSAGVHKVSVIYSFDGKTWYPCIGSSVCYADVTVANSKVTSCVVHPSSNDMSAFAAKLTGNGYVNAVQEVEVSILNNRSDECFNGVVSMFVNGVQTTNAGLYLSTNSYDKVYFYFTPTQTGTHSLTFWVVDPYTNAMLYQLKGTRTVQITQGPNGQVEATLLSPEAKTFGGRNYVYDTTTSLEIDMYNNTRNSVNGYVMLKRDDQLSWVYWQPTVNSYDHRLLTHHVDDLVKGRTYTYSVYYNESDHKIDGARKLCSYSFTVSNGAPGDVNEDGKVDISDIVAVINQIAGGATYKNADVNTDRKVDISDIVAIINIIATQ